MPEQFILEFIADPSGLKPAIDALKAFGTLTQEQAASFNTMQTAWQANIQKSTAQLQEHTTGVKQMAEAVKAIPITAATKAMQEQSAATVKLTSDIKNVTGSYNDLKARAAELDKEFRSTGNEEARSKFLALRGEMKEVELQNRTLVKSMATTAGSTAQVASAISGMMGAMAAGSEITKMFYGESEEGAKKAASAQQKLVIVMGAVELARALHEAAEVKTMILAKATLLQHSLGITTSSALAAAKIKEAAATQALALEQGLLNIAREAGIIEEEQEVVLSKELATTKGIETLLESENTAAKWAGVAAQKALNAAMGPLGVAAGVLLGIVALYEAFKEKTLDAKEAQELLNKVIEAGFKITEQKVSAANAQRDEELKGIDEKIAKAKAEGQSDQSILDVEIERNAKRREFADQAKKEHGDLLSYAQNREAMEKGIAKALAENAAIEQKIYNAKTGHDAASYHASLEIEDLEKRKTANEKYIEFVEKNLKLGTEIKKESDEAEAESEVQKTTKERKEAEQRLKDRKAYFDTLLASTRDYEEKNLQAHIGDIRAQLAIDLDNENLSQQERAAKRAEAHKAEQEATDTFNTNRLTRDKEMLAMQLQYIIGNAEKKRDITFKILEDETKLKVIAAKGDATMIKAIQEAANQQMLKNQVDYEYNVRAEKLKTAQMQAQAGVSAAVPGTNNELEKKQQLIEATAALEKNDAEHSIQNEQQKQARILQIDAEAAKKQKDLIENKAKNDLDDQTKLLEQLQKRKELEQNKDNPDLTNGRKRALAQLELQQQIQLDKDLLKANQNYADESIEHEKQVAADILKIKKDLQDKENELKKQDSEFQKQGQEEIKKFMIQSAQEVSDTIFENAKQARDNELAAEIEKMEAQKNSELLNNTLTAQQRNAINEKYRKEEANLKLQAWKADQKSKEEQALINGLLAFTSALATVTPTVPNGLIAGAAALATSGVQAALIASKTPPRFAKGVIGLQGPGTETSDSIQAYLSKGESVMTARATRKYGPMLEAMNAGTFLPPHSPSPNIAGIGSQAKDHSLQLDYDKLSDAITRKMPAPVTNHIELNETGFTKYLIKNGSRKQNLSNQTNF